MADLSDVLAAVPASAQQAAPSQLQLSPADLGLGGLNMAAQTPDLSAPGVGNNKTYTQQVKGPFGSHGVLGNVLGVLGDIVLANAGLKPQYLPKLNAAHQADALSKVDFASDPQGSLAQLANVVGAAPAQDIFNSQVTNQAREQQIAQEKQKMAIDRLLFPAQVAKATEPILTRARAIIGSAKDEKSYPSAYNMAAKYLSQYTNPITGLPYSINDIGAPAEYDADAVKQVREGGMTPAEQSTSAYHDLRGEQLGEGLQIDRQKAAEIARHNLANEGIGQQNASSNASRAAVYKEVAPRNASTAAANSLARSRDIDSLIAGRAAKAAKAKTPPVGYKNANGLTFKGGDPNDRNNWK